jgi:hypothetical protein
MRNREEKEVSIGGRTATLITFNDTSEHTFAQIHLVTAAKTRDNPLVSLSFLVKAKSGSDPQIIRSVYESLRFLGH